MLNLCLSELTKNQVTRKCAACCKRAGLKGLKLHRLGHFFATESIDANVDIMTLSKLLRYCDLRTSAVCVKTQMPVLQSAVNRLEDGISSL